MLENFLSDESKKMIFERNINLIRLVDLGNSLDEMEISNPRLDESGLHDYIEELKFESMLKESTWKKYIKTFKTLQEKNDANIVG